MKKIREYLKEKNRDQLLKMYETPKQLSKEEPKGIVQNTIKKIKTVIKDASKFNFTTNKKITKIPRQQVMLRNDENKLVAFKLYEDQELGFVSEFQNFQVKDNKRIDDDIDTDEEYLERAQAKCAQDLIEALNNLEGESESQVLQFIQVIFTALKTIID